MVLSIGLWLGKCLTNGFIFHLEHIRKVHIKAALLVVLAIYTSVNGGCSKGYLMDVAVPNAVTKLSPALHINVFYRMVKLKHLFVYNQIHTK